MIAPWKVDAIEGKEREFPSIASKIKQMEEDAKKPLAMYEVPDVKAKMRTGAPAAKWMEARKLILVNSYFVKDIKGYNRKGRDPPKIEVSPPEPKVSLPKLKSSPEVFKTLPSTSPFKKDSQAKSTYSIVDCKPDLENKSIVDYPPDCIEVDFLSCNELCILLSCLLLLFLDYVCLCLLPAFKLFFFLIAILASACFFLYRD